MNEIVLIISDNVSAAKIIASRLGHDGYNVQITEFDGQKLHNLPRQPPIAILLHFTDFIEAVPHIKSVLSEYYQTQSIPFIGAFARQGQINLDEMDSALLEPAHPVQIAHRLRSIIRLTAMQTEIGLRQKTLREDFNITHRLPNDIAKKPLRILFVGQAKPGFLILINALQEQNVEVIAAFTSFSAFEFLHESKFDGVVISALDSSDLAIALMETMRRNSSLYHLPAILLTVENFSGRKEAYEKGAADLINASLPETEIRGRIIELAKFHRLQNALREQFSALHHKACHDISGTYNLQFFRAHLEQQQRHYTSLGKSVTVMLVDFASKSGEYILPDKLSIARSEAGSILKNIVRIQDVSARLLPNRYAISLPGQSPIDLNPLENRIKHTFEASAFNTGISERPNFAFDVQIQFLELTPELNINDWFHHLIHGTGVLTSAPTAAPLSYTA